MITIIICTWNNEKNINHVINNAIINNPAKIIIVDANSTDQTIDIINLKKKRFPDIEIYKDKGQGLAIARNIGLKHVKTKYVMYLGADNILSTKYTLPYIETFLEDNKWTGCGLITRVALPKNYLEKCNNMRWKIRFYSGERTNIGTPFIWKTKVLKKYKFDDKLKYADDTDLCKRLHDNGHKMGYINIPCYEIGYTKWKHFFIRYMMYGKCDKWHYDKWKSKISFKEKVKLILHPLRAELFGCMKKIEWFLWPYYLPFFCYITFIRYYGWIKK